VEKWQRGVVAEVGIDGWNAFVHLTVTVIAPIAIAVFRIERTLNTSKFLGE
jgi:hypothetical protein